MDSQNFRRYNIKPLPLFMAGHKNGPDKWEVTNLANNMPIKMHSVFLHCTDDISVTKDDNKVIVIG